jgi:hypothetical protein
VAPPPKPPRDTPRRSLSSKDPFETDDFNPRAGEDPFGMGEFTGAQFDQRILEMKVSIGVIGQFWKVLIIIWFLFCRMDSVAVCPLVTMTFRWRVWTR